MSIPLKAFRKSIQGVSYKQPPEQPPRKGDVAYLLWFSTGDDDRGLVIDRMWVSRGENQL